MHKMDYGLIQSLKTRVKTDDDYLLLKKIVSESKDSASFVERVESYENVLNTVTYANRVAKKMQYEAQKRADEIRGEEFKKIIEPGMFVKCKGTKDGRGIREVLEVSKVGITARKIQWNGFKKHYYRDSYITTHGWNKIVKILDNITLT